MRKSCSYIRECIERRLSCERRCILGNAIHVGARFGGRGEGTPEVFSSASFPTAGFIATEGMWICVCCRLVYDRYTFVTVYHWLMDMLFFERNKSYVMNKEGKKEEIRRFLIQYSMKRETLDFLVSSYQIFVKVYKKLMLLFLSLFSSQKLYNFCINIFLHAYIFRKYSSRENIYFVQEFSNLNTWRLYNCATLARWLYPIVIRLLV